MQPGIHPDITIRPDQVNVGSPPQRRLIVGTPLLVTGKKWATREKVFRSLQLFMEHVAPKLRDLVPEREPDTAGA